MTDKPEQPAVTRAWSCPTCERLFWQWARLATKLVNYEAEGNRHARRDTHKAYMEYIDHRLKCEVK